MKVGRVGVTLKTRRVRHKRLTYGITLSIRVKDEIYEKILDIQEAMGKWRYAPALRPLITWYVKTLYEILQNNEKSRRYELILKQNGDITIREVEEEG